MNNLNNSFILKLFISILCGFLGLLLLKNHVGKERKVLDKIYEPVSIIVPKSKIKLDSTLTIDNLAKRYIPRNYIGNDIIRETEIDLILGKKTVKSFEPGELISSKHISKSAYETDGDEVGLRLFPVRIDSILPDDIMVHGKHIDIILTYEKSDGKQITRAVLQNIEIRRASFESEPRNQGGPTYFLLLKPKQAVIYAHAAQKGKLSYVFRKNKDDIIIKIPPVNDSNFYIGDKYLSKRSPNPGLEIISSRF